MNEALSMTEKSVLAHASSMLEIIFFTSRVQCNIVAVAKSTEAHQSSAMNVFAF